MSTWCQNCGNRPVYIENGRVYDYCGRRCASQALNRPVGRGHGQSLCTHSHRYPQTGQQPFCSPTCDSLALGGVAGYSSGMMCQYCKTQPRNGHHPFCSPGCASQALRRPVGQPSQNSMCQYCGIRPRNKHHPFCGRYCASLGSGQMCQHCGTQPRNGSHPFCGILCASQALGPNVGGAGGGPIVSSQSAGPWYKPVFKATSFGRSTSQGGRLQIKFYDRNDPHYGFTNFSDHAVVYKGKTYPTSEHLFQAFKFLGHEDKLADQIRRGSSKPKAALDAATQWRRYQRSDWLSVNIEKMDQVLKLKFSQHPSLRQELMDTRDAELIEDSPIDAFWGVGSNGQGQNQLGKALERLRADFRAKGY